MSTNAINPLFNDIRYKEGLKCMNSGLYEEAIELLCSLSEEWSVGIVSQPLHKSGAVNFMFISMFSR